MGKIDIVKAKQLREEGKTLEEIAKYFDVTKQAVHEALKKAEEDELKDIIEAIEEADFDLKDIIDEDEHEPEQFFKEEPEPEEKKEEKEESKEEKIECPKCKTDEFLVYYRAENIYYCEKCNTYYEP